MTQPTIRLISTRISYPQLRNTASVVHFIYMKTEEILEERGNTHGDFTDNARLSQRMKHVISSGQTVGLNPVQYEALDMICHKIARICCGDPNFKDHWDDIAGYATLVANRLEDEQD